MLGPRAWGQSCSDRNPESGLGLVHDEDVRPVVLLRPQAAGLAQTGTPFDEHDVGPLQGVAQGGWGLPETKTRLGLPETKY